MFQRRQTFQRFTYPFFVVLSLFTAGTAEADLPEEGTADAKIAVAYSRFDPASAASIERSISAQLSGTKVDAVYHRLADLPTAVEGQIALAKELLAADSAIAAFVIYSSPPYVFVRTVFVTEKGVLADTRTVDTADATPLHETLGIIVRAATAAVMERPANRPPTAEAPPPPPDESEATSDAQPPSRPSRSPESHRLYFGLGAALGMYSKGLPPWLGLDLELGWHASRNIYILLGYTGLAKISNSKYEVELTLRRNPFRFGLGLSRPMKRLTLGGSVMFEVDYVTETVSTRNSALNLNADTSEVHLAALARLHLDVTVHGPLDFFLNLEAEIPLDSTEYFVSTQEQGRMSLIKLLPVQPVLRSGFKVHFF